MVQEYKESFYKSGGIMEAINELDNKYLVMKWDDVRNNLSLSQRRELVSIIQYNDKCRELEGKEENNYVVLNLDDKIDIIYLTKQLDRILSRILKVEDIATDLVNAVLKAEE